MNFNVAVIGIVHSSLKEIADCPRQEHEYAPSAEIELFEQYAKALTGLKPGMELLLFTWLDRANRSVLETQPRNDPAAPLTGVFLTRSPDRPNPIGIHHVKITLIKPDGRLTVDALEVLDHTPVIDIKSVENR